MTHALFTVVTPKFPANGDAEYLKRLTRYKVVGAAVGAVGAEVGAVGAKVGAVGLAVGAGAVTHAHTIVSKVLHDAVAEFIQLDDALLPKP